MFIFKYEDKTVILTKNGNEREISIIDDFINLHKVINKRDYEYEILRGYKNGRVKEYEER